MPITNYSQYMDPVTGKGKLALYPDYRSDTEAAAGHIDWGVAVQLASDTETVQTYNGEGRFQGVAMANHFAEYLVSNMSTDEVDGYYRQGEPVSVMKKGVIWVEVLEDVAKGQNAVADNASGNFRAEGSAIEAVSGVVGVFRTSAQADGFAQLEINLP